MDWVLLPPEINSARMHCGPGAGSLLTAAAAWESLADELADAAQSFTAIVRELLGVWSGPSAAAMAHSASTYSVWLQSASDRARNLGAATRSVAGAFQAAFAATVPPSMVAANRSQTHTLRTLNLFGQFTPHIAALDATYAQMWAQDVAAMNTYHAETQAATAHLTPLQSPQQATTQPTSHIDLSPSGWIGQIFLNVLSSGPWQLPTEVLSLLTGLWVISSVSSLPEVLNKIRTDIDVEPAPVVQPAPPPKLGPVKASTGSAPQIGKITVPPNWASPSTPGQRTSTYVREERTNRPLPIPVAIPNISQRSRDEQVRSQPRYGDVPAVTPKTPAGG